VILPKNGAVTVPGRLCAGIELDLAKIERERYLRFEVS
jgi:hypothetical protein